MNMTNTEDTEDKAYRPHLNQKQIYRGNDTQFLSNISHSGIKGKCVDISYLEKNDMS